MIYSFNVLIVNFCDSAEHSGFNELEGAWHPKFILEIEWFAHNCILIVASTSADVSEDTTLDLVLEILCFCLNFG